LGGGRCEWALQLVELDNGTGWVMNEIPVGLDVEKIEVRWTRRAHQAGIAGVGGMLRLLWFLFVRLAVPLLLTDRMGMKSIYAALWCLGDSQRPLQVEICCRPLKHEA